MIDIEQKALALVNEIAAARGTSYPCVDRANDSRWEALCRAIEQHEAFRQEVSDVVEAYLNPNNRIYSRTLYKFIIPKPKPDPLVEVVKVVTWYDNEITAKELRAALEARGLEIRSKNDD
jgi:hypothetical protein